MESFSMLIIKDLKATLQMEWEMEKAVSTTHLAKFILNLRGRMM